MSRKRMIWPGFWEDSELGQLPLQARLLYIATWNLADDAGLLKADPAWLRAAVFGYDCDITAEHVEGWLVQLTETKHILPYSVEGKNYYCLRTFHKYQRLDHPTPSKLPQPPSEVLDRLGATSLAALRERHAGPRPTAAERGRP